MTRDIPPHSLGLGGDGDEVAAIAEVEHRFGVTLNYSDARRWQTVGDVFVVLQTELPPEQAASEGTWRLFTQALSQETGVDPTKITRETLLLGTSRTGWRGYLFAVVIGLIVLAASRFW